METKIEKLKTQLLELLIEYQQLNSKTKGAYDWREQAIEAQLDVVYSILNDTTCELVADWERCVKEDRLGL